MNFLSYSFSNTNITLAPFICYQHFFSSFDSPYFPAMKAERDSDIAEGNFPFGSVATAALPDADLLPGLPPRPDGLFLSSSSAADNTLPFPHQSQLSPAASFDSVPLYPPKPYDFPTDPAFFLDFFSNPLPALHSLEHPHPGLAESSSPQKRVRVQEYFPASSCPQSFNCKPPSEVSQYRGQRITDRTRLLQKLMPWNKRMDTATMLEEARKYVRFLQAQVAVLQAMPISSSFGQNLVDMGFGPLGILNRPQLLQVMLNSPVAQTVLSEQGLCVFAYEQLVMLKRAVAQQPPFSFRG